MEKVEWDDVQRLVLSGYPRLPFSAYLFWHFVPGDVSAAKRWLGALAGRLTCATERGDQQAIHVAITANGLKSLQVSAGILNSFSVEFLEGMAPQPTAGGLSRRSNILGDLGDSSPRFWEWGGWTKDPEIDGLLLLYAHDKPSLAALVAAEIDAMRGAAQPALQRDGKNLMIEGYVSDDRKEHFGFKDGISQPVIEGSPKANRKGKKWWRNADPDDGKELTREEKYIHLVKPGEFVLGYENERRTSITNAYPPEDTKTTGAQDIRRNGSYLVFRQLEQDVSAFNDFVAQSAKLVYGNDDDTAKGEIAARLVGRTRDGHPLGPMNGSQGEPPRNDFLYYFEDRFGMACPIGAHIRRANPRDTIGPDADTALRLSKMHRIIRRGRPYGEGISASDKPADQRGSRGISFIALNADIAGQFEMIQHSWLNNMHFGGLHAGVDPFGHLSCPGDVIVIQDRPTNHYIGRPRPFVRVRGGAYFFLPGIAAVRALAM